MRRPPSPQSGEGGCSFCRGGYGGIAFPGGGQGRTLCARRPVNVSRPLRADNVRPYRE